MVSAGSSLKFCLVAEQKADIYPRFGPTMEWDTAAGQAISEGAGAGVFRMDDGTPLAYNKPDLLNPFFKCITRKSVRWLRKKPNICVALHPSSLRRTLSTTHSSGSRRLDLELFSLPSQIAFYELSSNIFKRKPL